MPGPAVSVLSRPTPASPSRASLAALACLTLFCLLPVLLVDIPAMVDYPNHLARMSILARAGTVLEHPLYQIAWAPYPNLAMDVIVPPVARWIGVEAATKLFYLVSQILIVGGAAALAAAAGGRTMTAGIIACLLLYSMPFAFGFVNFEFALGLALFALAIWVRLANRPLGLRLAVHAIAVTILYFAHLFALGIYGFAIGLIEALAVEAGPAAAAPRCHSLGRHGGTGDRGCAPGRCRRGAVGGTGTNWSVGAKLYWLSMLNGWSREFSLVPTLFLAVPLCLAFMRGWLRLVGPGPWLAVGFALLFLVLPFRLFDTAFVDGRVLLAALLILPAFSAARFPRERTAGSSAQRSSWPVWSIPASRSSCS